MNTEELRKKFGNKREWLSALTWVVSCMAAAVVLMMALFYQFTGDPGALFKYFRTIYLIEAHYPGDIDKKALFDGSMEGMVKTLGDKHSVYLDGDAFQQFAEQTHGTFAGVGVYISKSDDGAIIGGVIDDSPASEAGLQRGDVIVAVDGKDLKDMAIEDISAIVRGPVDSQVVLTIRRDGADQDYTITRREVHMQTVGGQMIEGTDIGYIRVAIFSENTGEEFDKKFEELRGQGMNKFILDLRDNPGGLVDQATAVASHFVPPDSTIVSYTDRNGHDQAFTATGREDRIPMVVLVNGNSASASEIVAGDVQDLQLGQVIGTKTYGKGTVQGIYGLGKDSAVKLTVAKYKTTKGREIDGVGVIPDIEVELQPGDTEDRQFEKALEVLKGL